MWRYVALCGAIPQFEHNHYFLNVCYFCCFQEVSKNSGGARWRQLVLCGPILNFGEN